MVETFSTAGGRFCSDDTYDADHVAGLFKMAFNDPSERSFGSMTYQIQYYNKMGLTNTGGINQVIVNGDLSHGFDTGCKNKIPNWWRKYSIIFQRRLWCPW